MRTRLAAFGIAMTAVMLAGCSPMSMAMSGGKTAFRVVQGAQAKVRPLKDVSAADVAPYRSIRLGEVSTDVPALIPASQLGIVRTAMLQELGSEASLKRFPGHGKVLVANVVCRFLKERGTFGGEARLDLIVALADVETKNEVGRLFIEGISDSPIAGKAEDMAKAGAAELVDYLSKQQQGKTNG
jgi:hypothetical protein